MVSPINSLSYTSCNSGTNLNTSQVWSTNLNFGAFFMQFITNLSLLDFHSNSVKINKFKNEQTIIQVSLIPINCNNNEASSDISRIAFVSLIVAGFD